MLTFAHRSNPSLVSHAKRDINQRKWFYTQSPANLGMIRAVEEGNLVVLIADDATRVRAAIHARERKNKIL